MKRLLLIAGLAALFLVAAALIGVGRPEQARSAAASPPSGITATGVGKVTTVPNRAGFSFGVTTQGQTANAALRANADQMRRLIDAIRRAGVDEDDVQTEQVSLYPRMSDDGQAIVGYQATNSVSAQIDDLARAGALVDAAAAAGANQISGPILTRSDQDELYKDALEAAVEDARAKAEALAAAAGVDLGSATKIVEGSGGPQPVPFEARAAIAQDSATPIEPGTQKLEASVTVTFAIG